MKIGIVTFWDTPVNYGQVLQGYALEQKLRGWGHIPFIVRYTMAEEVKFDTFKMKIMRILRGQRTLADIVKRFTSKNQNQIDRKFPLFKRQYMFYSEKFYDSYQSLVDDFEEADCYISGSDQVWGAWGSLYKKRVMLMSFLPDKVKRFSYAASFGRTSLSPEEESVFKNELKKYISISLRESSAVKLCNRLGFNEAVEVLDPTLLYTKDEWINMLGLTIKKPEKKKAFIYMVGIPKQILKRIILYLEDREYEIANVETTAYIDTKTGIQPTIEEWLELILGSSLVVTNSFHGTVLSVNFNTKVLSLSKQLRGKVSGQDERIKSMLHNVGLSEYFLTDFSDSTFDDLIKKNVNWLDVNEKMKAMRIFSNAFLKETLDKISTL